ncbi:Xylose isomerase-like TIM barrel [Polystyrenella longa]|uniref:Xylose isomerase-like TIM barrel n=1 Tax=Polystyrenella longa TaxID=2528007 RepID=A0A518CSB3_9PLAN|nr:metabolite traffic protein EboE [Polystyrenella longa]QDU82121.1 Xylose isomerase-like TIM barrel [Polystyrenella longa]
MSLSTLPLCYCTNVHAAQTVPEVLAGLTQYTVPVKAKYGSELAAGLWLAKSVTDEILSEPDGVTKLAQELAARDLTCHTLNAFPYGNFHSDRVKEQVYLPDWSTDERLNYTFDCARILAGILPEGREGSISTVPLGFKQFDYADNFEQVAIGKLIELAQKLDDLHDETGNVVRLAIEPEPFCLLETTDETIAFFEKLFAIATEQNLLDEVKRHIGVCYDVCHQSIEFENVGASIKRLEDQEIRINKVHITCAIEIKNPGTAAELREVLSRYVEPRYLHQTMARNAAGEIRRLVDLTKEFAMSPPADFAEADVWRVHYHVPVNAEQVGPLGTTRHDLKKALDAVHQLTYAPHLEVETYTWDVLPENKVDLVEGLTQELVATRKLLGSIRLAQTNMIIS